MKGKTYITSNMQLGRPSAIGKWKRPFKNVDEMTETLIKNWNDTVTDRDVVYHLGNFAWDPKTAYDSVMALKGREIYFIQAETDAPLIELWEKDMLPKKVKIIDDICFDSEKGRVYSYWPLKEWKNKSKGVYNIIGFPNRKYKTNPKNKVINCSVEQCNYKPQDLESILGLLNEIG